MKSLIALLALVLLATAPVSALEKSSDYYTTQNETKSKMEFTVTFDEAKNTIRMYYPQINADELFYEFIEERDIQRRIVDGSEMFFTGFESNLFYRDLDLVEQNPEWADHFTEAVRFVLSEYGRERQAGFAEFKQPWSAFFDPREFLVEYSIEVPRLDLPDEGDLKIWLPLPLNRLGQDMIEIIDIVPAENVVGFPRIDGEIAYMLLSFELVSLEEDLNIKVLFSFRHFRQEFDIDPSQIGDYDWESPLYIENTLSTESIYYNEEMKDLAGRIIGEEKNAYLQARLLYDYVVENIFYSLIAHASLEAEGIPESLFAMEHGYGDCGMQSMFFAALCRSIGIPARTPGGFQLFSGQLGTHFWAEFYLPNYGWIPVDTSVGQGVMYSVGVTEEESRIYKDFYFGNLDPLRMVVQNSVDMMPEERPKDIQPLEKVMQFPFVESEFGNENLELSDLITDSFTIRALPLR